MARVQTTSTHCQYFPEGVLIAEDKRSPVPEGQSVEQVDEQKGEATDKAGQECFLTSYILCQLQVFMIAVV